MKHITSDYLIMRKSYAVKKSDFDFLFFALHQKSRFFNNLYAKKRFSVQSKNCDKNFSFVFVFVGEEKNGKNQPQEAATEPAQKTTTAAAI